MTRRILYLISGLALALIAGISLSTGVTAALPGITGAQVLTPLTCGTPGPWTVASPIPTAVFGPMTASDGTYAYSAGGYSFQVPGPTNQFARYDQAANSWTALAPLPVAAYDGAAVFTNNKIYVFGGTDGSTVFATTYIYDIATNAWSLGAPLPAPREQMGAGYSNGKIYIAGGSDSQNINPQNTLYDYDIDSNFWTTQAPLPQALAGPGSGVVNAHLYVAGGRERIHTKSDNCLRLQPGHQRLGHRCPALDRRQRAR